MKTKDIAKNYQLNLTDFDRWLKHSGFPVKPGLTGLSLDDSSDPAQIVGQYRVHLVQEKAREVKYQDLRA